MHDAWAFSSPARLDRAAHLRDTVDLDAVPAVLTAGGRVLVHGSRLARVAPAQRPASQAAVYLGRDADGDLAALAVVVGTPGDESLPDADAIAPGSRWVTLRDAWALLEDADGAGGASGAGTGGGLEIEIAATAVAMVGWHERHPLCPRCGTPTRPVNAGWARRCDGHGGDPGPTTPSSTTPSAAPQPGDHYPRTDPAVIVAITDPDDRLLLAHVSYHSPNRFSHLAGYVEPGESLEQAVHREVAEEAGITVTDLRYAGSQPWPFPASIMVGFTARATSTDIEVDGVEVEVAHWFTREELAARVADGSLRLAPPGSIARALVDQWHGGPVAGA